MPTNPNPQGKGLVPALEALMACQPVQICAKQPRHLLADYLTSLLVLSAEFSFRIVPGQTYYLYLKDDVWKLSLIAPEQWRSERRGHAIGACELQQDMTWRLEPHSGLAHTPKALQMLADFHTGFLELIGQSGTLEESLPTYAAHLPFYRRALATGLATSLRRSITLSGLSDRSDWADRAVPTLLELTAARQYTPTPS